MSRMISTMIENMIVWAKSRLGDSGYAGWCLAFIEDALEISNDIEIFGGDSAKESSELYADAMRTNAPELGAFVFYDCLCPSEDGPVNWGHCGIALGDGNVIHAWDEVRIDNYLEIEHLTALTGNQPHYIGWVPVSRVLAQKPDGGATATSATATSGVESCQKLDSGMTATPGVESSEEGRQEHPDLWGREIAGEIDRKLTGTPFDSRFILPDYNNCLVNLANSVLKEFGAETSTGTLALAEQYFGKKHKNVVLLVLDALGISILEKHLIQDGFFRSHLVGAFDSVFPPTTVAATTSVMSGLYPNEHGWLGWDMFYPELQKNVEVFTNRDQLTEKEGAVPGAFDADGKPVWGKESLAIGKAAADFHAGYRFTPYQSIVDKIKDAGGTAFYSMPFEAPYPRGLDEVLQRTVELCAEPSRKFIYAYWTEPDTTMHRTGTVSRKTHELVVSIEKKLEEFAVSLSDTLLLITADHGHIDSKNLCILDYPEVMDCLVRMPSFEPRALNLFVKKERNADFPAVFKKCFGDDFILLTREEVLGSGLFGIGKNRPGLDAMIGDFVAVAVSETSIFNEHYSVQHMPGVHAGMTREEYIIPLIVVEK